MARLKPGAPPQEAGRTRCNALSCRRAWSAASEGMPLSVWTDPVVMGGVLGALRDAVLGSSRASTPVGPSRARVVD